MLFPYPAKTKIHVFEVHFILFDCFTFYCLSVVK